MSWWLYRRHLPASPPSRCRFWPASGCSAPARGPLRPVPDTGLAHLPRTRPGKSRLTAARRQGQGQSGLRPVMPRSLRPGPARRTGLWAAAGRAGGARPSTAAGRGHRPRHRMGCSDRHARPAAAGRRLCCGWHRATVLCAGSTASSRHLPPPGHLSYPSHRRLSYPSLCHRSR
jgi:hypothetical protein